MKICSINLWELSFDVDDSLGESVIGSGSRHLDVLVDGVNGGQGEFVEEDASLREGFIESIRLAKFSSRLANTWEVKRL